MMDCVLKMMSFVLKMMIFALKMKGWPTDTTVDGQNPRQYPYCGLQ